MVRWEPGAAGRLREAAMALYAEQGYDGTTVAQIADRAGVTARTFFRYFADKREVLFAGSEELERVIADAVIAAPAEAGPMEAVAAGVLAAGEAFVGRRDFARQRYAVVAATPELREREFIKMASLVEAFRAALQERGVAPGRAVLAAETGITVFRVAFERWVEGAEADLVVVIRETLGELSELTS
ncbi:helix-turn-helix domain-containing protein [Kribbella lupini]|uniref:TetR/AcrR family transcriptional regulator n=1 Tax=Kribbella lupini TaxID=291602 RepID=A0ABN2AI57_9ACTN